MNIFKFTKNVDMGLWSHNILAVACSYGVSGGKDGLYTGVSWLWRGGVGVSSVTSGKSDQQNNLIFLSKYFIYKFVNILGTIQLLKQCISSR